MTNQNNRRDFIQDEYDLYDKKAKTAWNEIARVTGYYNHKQYEDFQEDAVAFLNGKYYLTELQVVAYWHNYSLLDWQNNYILSNMYIAASKVEALKDRLMKYDNIHAGKLIFFNCVPNEYLAFDVEDLNDSMLQERYGERTYIIPLTTKHRYMNAKNIINNSFNNPRCDCKENHFEIIKRFDSRVNNEQKKENVRGRNGICCR